MPELRFIISTAMYVLNIECDLWYKHVVDVVQSIEITLTYWYIQCKLRVMVMNDSFIVSYC